MKLRTRLRPVSAKTRAQRWPVLKALRAQVLARAKGRCEYVAIGGLWHHGAIEVHHIVRRSQGGRDHPDNLVALCRKHHQETDRPFASGRLCIRALGDGAFLFILVTAPDKWGITQT